MKIYRNKLRDDIKESLNEAVSIPAPYNRYFKLRDSNSKARYHVGDEVRGYGCHILGLLQPTQKKVLNVWPYLVDDPDFPVVTFAGNRMYGVDLPDTELTEDTVKQGNKWVNKGDTGKTHGKFKTKKEADAQRKAMFANGYTEELQESTGLSNNQMQQLRKQLNRIIFSLWYDGDDMNIGGPDSTRARTIDAYKNSDYSSLAKYVVDHKQEIFDRDRVIEYIDDYANKHRNSDIIRNEMIKEFNAYTQSDFTKNLYLRRDDIKESIYNRRPKYRNKSLTEAIDNGTKVTLNKGAWHKDQSKVGIVKGHIGETYWIEWPDGSTTQEIKGYLDIVEDETLNESDSNFEVNFLNINGYTETIGEYNLLDEAKRAADNASVMRGGYEINVEDLATHKVVYTVTAHWRGDSCFLDRNPGGRKYVNVDTSRYTWKIEESLNENVLDSPSKEEIAEFLDELGGYTDYDGKIEALIDEFGFDRDEAEYAFQDWAMTADEEYEDEEESSNWIEVKSKPVRDSDGFLTDYTMYQDANDENHFVFVFGDSDLYRPEDEDWDWEVFNEREANEWFDNYDGFEEDDEEF